MSLEFDIRRSPEITSAFMIMRHTSLHEVAPAPTDSSSEPISAELFPQYLDYANMEMSQWLKQSKAFPYSNIVY